MHAKSVLAVAAVCMVICLDITMADDDDDIVCPCQRILKPVCGIDGNDYDNECEAACVGIEVASYGKCDGSDGRFFINK